MLVRGVMINPARSVAAAFCLDLQGKPAAAGILDHVTRDVAAFARQGCKTRIAQRIRALADGAHIRLVEQMADYIAEQWLIDPGVSSAIRERGI